MIKANFTAVNESLAKTAKEMNSHFDYSDGTATSTQNGLTTKLVEYANSLLETHQDAESETIELVQSFCDKYSVKLAAAIDRENSIRSRCPSIMICGAGNFPTRKKEKQNEASEKFWKECGSLFTLDYNNYYFNKIGNVLCNTTIYSDDKNAVEKIKSKIATLETLPDPYGNKKAEIRRLKQRLLDLSPDEVKAGKSITINGLEATFDNIVALFSGVEPTRSNWNDKETYYITIRLLFSDGKRNYTECLQIETDAKSELVSTFGNSENNYQAVWKPLTDLQKFYLIISQIRGSGNKAVIFSILKDLAPKAETAEVEKYQELDSVKVIENKEAMRIQLIFDGKPSEEIRNILKSHAFKWSPSFGAWQRQLTSNGIFATKQALKKIKAVAQ